MPSFTLGGTEAGSGAGMGAGGGGGGAAAAAAGSFVSGQEHSSEMET